MSDLVIRNDQHLDVPTGTEPATAQLVAWAQAATAAAQFAQAVCGTQAVPAAYKDKPHEAAAAILAGAEVGLSPMASLRAFDNIQGTPAPKALTLRAIVQGKGHRVEVVESTPERAVVRGLRAGADEWQVSTWDIARAQAMGLANKPQWRQQPAAMLVARATAEVCRWIASDAIMGMPYTAEEVRDERGFVEARPRPQRVTAGEILDQVAEPTNGDDGPVTPDLLATLAGLFRVKGITDRADGLAFIDEAIGRTVASTKELTVGEAHGVIACLRELPDEPAADADGGDQ